MDKKEIATFKDRILIILAQRDRTYEELADIMSTDIDTIIKISNELKKDGLIHIIDTSSKTSKNDATLNIVPKGRFFINSNSFEQKFEKLKINEKHIKFIIEILVVIIAAISLYYTIKNSN